MRGDGIAQLIELFPPIEMGLAEKDERLQPDIFHPAPVDDLGDGDGMDAVLTILKAKAQRLQIAAGIAAGQHLNGQIPRRHIAASFSSNFCFIISNCA